MEPQSAAARAGDAGTEIRADDYELTGWLLGLLLSRVLRGDRDTFEGKGEEGSRGPFSSYLLTGFKRTAPTIRSDRPHPQAARALDARARRVVRWRWRAAGPSKDFYKYGQAADLLVYLLWNALCEFSSISVEIGDGCF